MNIWDIVILLAVAAAVALAVIKLFRNKKRGKGCCGDCSKCGGCAYQGAENK